MTPANLVRVCSYREATQQSHCDDSLGEVGILTHLFRLSSLKVMLLMLVLMMLVVVVVVVFVVEHDLVSYRIVSYRVVWRFTVARASRSSAFFALLGCSP